MTYTFFVLALCLLNVATMSSARYQPGEAGGPWSPEEVDIVRQKVMELMDQNNYVPRSRRNILRGRDRSPARRPTENKLLRLAFHDCIRYVDGSGGCDGCLNWKNMGFRYKNLFTFGKPKPPPHSYKVVTEGDNNDLAVTLKALEKIYTELDWPPAAPALTTSLIDSGKSRADLWVFASIVALEVAIERANYACDKDPARHQIALLEGREMCDIKLHKPIKFQYGRRDCLVTNPARPYEASKEEVHINLFGNGETFVTYMATQFGLEAKEGIALMGIHSIAQHANVVQNNVAGHRYGWVGAPYLSNMYYKRLGMLPVYRANPRPKLFFGGNNGFGASDPPTIFTGDVDGNPVDGYGWRAHHKDLWDSPFGGPFFFRPIDVECDENPSSSDALRAVCADSRDENGEWKVYDNECCAGAAIDERGIQTGGCQAGNFCRFDNQFALNIEMGFVYNFTFDEYGKAHGCAGLDTPQSQWNGRPIFGSPIVDCNKTTLAPQGEALSTIVEDFGKDHDAWIRSFLDAWPKMQANNYENGDLMDGPQNSWLGYESLKGQYDIEDYEDFINNNAPFVFTRSDVNPFICGECWFRFN